MEANMNDSEDSNGIPADMQLDTSDNANPASPGQDPSETPKPEQDASPAINRGNNVNEDELLYSTELTYEQRKELRMKKRNKKTTEEKPESKPSKPPKPAHLTKDALQNAPNHLATKKPNEEKKSSPLPVSKMASHRKNQEKPQSTMNVQRDDKKVSSHTNLKRRNQQLNEELGKLRECAELLEKKLEEKEHKICELKTEIASQVVDENNSDEKTSINTSEETQHNLDDVPGSAHHDDDAMNGNSAMTTEPDHSEESHESDHHTTQVKHSTDRQDSHGHDHTGSHAKGHSGNHGHATHKEVQESKMSNPWKASKKSHMV